MGFALSPFTINQHLQTGGYGQIWGGEHVQQKLPVAAKFLTASKARSPEFYAQFWHEVQTVARLNHPNIIMVFDYGVLPPHLTRNTQADLVSGSPYLVMEYASQGTLRDLIGHLTWDSTRAILLALLDALAYAHARGVIHRDFKPANVLINGPESPRPGLKLSDFGLAHALDRTLYPQDLDLLQDYARAGTLTYMAPEQFRGQWRDNGPWTDLYALGIVAYELVCGAPPFTGQETFDLAQQHLTQALPPLSPTFAVPSALMSWIQRLTHKDPRHRFQYAADAAWALQSLVQDDTTALHPVPFQLTQAHATTHSVANLTAMVTLNPLLTQTSQAQGVQVRWLQEDTPTPWSDTNNPESPETPPPPFPPSWETTDPQMPIHLQGAGLELYRLRALPMVGRQAQRHALWGALWDVRDTGKAGAVVLQGASGYGKSRLAEWLCEHAHEVGTAQILQAFHDSRMSQAAGLSNMMRWHFTCQGLTRQETRQRLQQQLTKLGVRDPYEWNAMTEVISSQDEPDDSLDGESAVRFNSPTERYVLLRRHLMRLGQQRPVIVMLDNAQWNIDALAFVRHVLEHDAHCPVLFVLTINHEALAWHPRERQLLEQLTQTDHVSTLEVAPLPPKDSKTLVESLLGLSGEVTSQIQERMQGNPLFAIQLIDDWIQRGILYLDPSQIHQGFTLRQDEPLLIPDSLHDIWNDRLERIITGLDPDNSRQALEVAAVLGVAVNEKELQSCTQHLGLRLPPTLIERLQQYKLATPTPVGWRFAHSMIRESLTRSSHEHHRWTAQHHACLSMLGQLYPKHPVETAARRAYHLQETGDFHQALTVLLYNARRYLDTSSFQQALDLLDSYDAILEKLLIEEADTRRHKSTTLRANIHRVQWELDDAESQAQHALTQAQQHQLKDIHGEALAILAHVYRHRGDVLQATTLAKQAQSIFEDLGDSHGVADTTLNLAIIARVSGDAREDALSLYQDAKTLFVRHEDHSKVAQCLYGMGNLHRQRQDYRTAHDLYTQAHTIFTRIGNRAARADCINALADVARYQGDLDDATRGYQKAWDLLRSIDSQNAPITRLNLGIAMIQNQRYKEAQTIFQQTLRTQQQPGFLAIAHVCLLPCLAHAGDTRAFDRHCTLGTRQIQAASIFDPDLANLARLAAQLLQERGHHTRAKAAYKLALAQWNALGNQDQIHNITQLMDALS